MPTLYFVTVCKDDYIADVRAGPFLDLRPAEEALAKAEEAEPNMGRCYWALATFDLPLEIVR